MRNGPRELEKRSKRISGNFTGGVTPVPIPNTEVKSTEVDGTVVSRPWESRTLPVYIVKSPIVFDYGALHFWTVSQCKFTIEKRSKSLRRFSIFG